MLDQGIFFKCILLAKYQSTFEFGEGYLSVYLTSSASKFNIVSMTLDSSFQYDHLFYDSIGSVNLLKAPLWLKSSISRELLLLVVANEGVWSQKGVSWCPTGENCPLTLMCFRHTSS